MAYTKKIWKDYPDTSTPITADDLNNIEDGIEDVDNRLSGIIESGSDTNGNYIKYADGTMICYGFKSNITTTTGGNADGSLYYADIEQFRAFPQEFIDIPNININAHTTKGQTYHGIWISLKASSYSKKGIGPYRIYSPTNVTLNVSIDYVAIGRWK